MKFRNIAFLFLFFLTANIFYCQKIDSVKSKKFQYYNHLLNTSTYNVLENSKKLLQNAQTPYEVTLSYFMLGSSMYRKSEYTNAIFYLEKAEQVGKGLKMIDFQWSYTDLLSMSYRRAGLISQSNDMWEKELALYKKSTDKYKEATYYYNLSKKNDVDEKYCLSSNARRKYLSLVPQPTQKIDKDYIFAVYSQLAFSDLKCGNEDLAEKSLSLANQYIDDSTQIKSATLVEIYDLTKAILYIRKGSIQEAKQLFDEAYKISKIKETPAVTKLILTERLEANIDEPQVQLEYSKEIEKIRKFETIVNKNLIQYETEKSKKQFAKQESKIRYWIISSVIFSFAIISIYCDMLARNRKLKIAYLKIIENLESQKSEVSILKPEVKSQEIVNTNESIVEIHEKELENENEIVKRLKEIEDKEFFISKNMSAAHMAVLLKITPRNLTYILKKYRNDDFYNYLNNVRVNYISSELRKNPKLLQYKIAALADLCGFNSHSQFATVFKAKSGISPSQYIQFLSNDK